MSAIPGYRLNDPTLPPSPVTKTQFEELKASLLFGPDDVAALKRAHDGLKPQAESILDVWYGFVGGNPHLLRYFSTPAGEPVGAYLDAVRKRFGQWILDTCRADYDAAWLAYQDEIGKRHHRMGKNKTDGVTAAPHIPMSQLLALAIPISVTMKPFLAKRALRRTPSKRCMRRGRRRCCCKRFCGRGLTPKTATSEGATMNIDVYDTYATSKAGKTIHFDVFLPSGSNKETALRHARAFLESIGETAEALKSERCNFCHSERAHPVVETEIAKSGRYILQMEGCPHPNR